MPIDSRDLHELRELVRKARTGSHADILRELVGQAGLDQDARQQITSLALKLVSEIRSAQDTGLLEEFFREYGLSTREGLALMSLAEALMRIPDAETRDALIEDKIASSHWSVHFGHSPSSLVNISTLGLMAAGSILQKSSDTYTGAIHEMVKRLGEPVIRVAMNEAMKLLGERFVLGQTIEQAIDKSRSSAASGFTFSYDMLGEAAKTSMDADRYLAAYRDAISAISRKARKGDIRSNPGISVKLSALCPRYEAAQAGRAVEELSARLSLLVNQAAGSAIGLNIDAEEMERLDLSLDIIERVLAEDSLADWDGFGVVVQAYSPCASYVIDWLYALADNMNRRIMVRLVKGAYWDTEIKRSQVMGLESFPVFTRKAETDASYIACARKLLGMTDKIYPQFATHNAHTVAAVLHLVKQLRLPANSFEFQRLHGMGASLHKMIMKQEDTRCRIYAPVGRHHDLLAYLVRRLLENGANSSFINQIVDDNIAPEKIAADPFALLERYQDAILNPAIRLPSELYAPKRKNSRGWDISNLHHVRQIEEAVRPFMDHHWSGGPVIACETEGDEERQIRNPAFPDKIVGTIVRAGQRDVENALKKANDGRKNWSSLTALKRAEILRRAADLYEDSFGELFALLIREAGKTIPDCIAEVREAVDFLRYYASEAVRLEGRGRPRGIISCISPWNFPLAIFTGQIAGALAAGNVVLAKPAEATPLIAFRAVTLLHKAGIPLEALQFLPGSGSKVGAMLCADPAISGVCFTGSLPTAQSINRALAGSAAPDAMLVAETGGLNAMIADSTALPEQAVTDIIASAFQSAGQRCSALRILYVQEDIADGLLGMLFGAMEELKMGDPADLSTDIGPVIDEYSKMKISSYIENCRKNEKVLRQLEPPSTGCFVGPAAISVSGIGELGEEIFGPVLHVATFRSDQIDQVINDINKSGYGLTFGLHSRIGDRVNDISGRIHAGNIYVNRNQIGAIVESQPFGGEGLSGTGPKAGGPRYVQRFRKHEGPVVEDTPHGSKIDLSIIQEAVNNLGRISRPRLEATAMPGPSGEANTLATYPRGVILCLGPSSGILARQISDALEYGCPVLALAPDGYLHHQTGAVSSGKLIVLEGWPDIGLLEKLEGIAGVSWWGNDNGKRRIRKTLAARSGAIIPLITESCGQEIYVIERHLCVNTAAAGGDTSLFSIADS